MIKVLVVDDHQLVRVGTARLLSDESDIEVVGQAASGEEAVEKSRQLRPDVILMDVQMPGMGGLEATKRCIRGNEDVKVIAVTVYEEEPHPSQLMGVGAAGYLTKRADVSEIVRAIRTVCAGQRYISTDVAQQLALRPYSSKDSSPFELLSGREMQITMMVVGGHTVPEISKNLSLSSKTINSYRYRIFEKLSIRNDVTLTKMAIKYGLINAEAVA